MVGRLYNCYCSVQRASFCKQPCTIDVQHLRQYLHQWGFGVRTGRSNACCQFENSPWKRFWDKSSKKEKQSWLYDTMFLPCKYQRTCFHCHLWKNQNSVVRCQMEVLLLITTALCCLMTVKTRWLSIFQANYNQWTQSGDDSEAEEDKGLPLGARLIAKSDCKTCHNAEVKRFGPSYRDIAVKYETNASNVRSLVQKLEMEAVGVWGNVAMTAPSWSAGKRHCANGRIHPFWMMQPSKNLYSQRKFILQSSCGAGYQCPFAGEPLPAFYDVPSNTQAVPAMPNKSRVRQGLK